MPSLTPSPDRRTESPGVSLSRHDDRQSHRSRRQSPHSRSSSIPSLTPSPVRRSQSPPSRTQSSHSRIQSIFYVYTHFVEPPFRPLYGYFPRQSYCTD